MPKAGPSSSSTLPASPSNLLWITGAGGLIGNQLARLAPLLLPDWKTFPLTRRDLDLTDRAAVERRFRHDAPDLIIHCAGLTLSRDCKANPALARQLNVDVTRFLASLAVETPLVFFSTDLVFDGRQGARRECDPVNPLNIYGETKVEAEQIVLANPLHSVIRTSLNYGCSPKGNRSFNEEMLAAWEAGQVLALFVDEFRCPIPAEVTARAVLALARAGAFTRARQPGEEPRIYHVAGAERLSRWEIGQLLVEAHPQFRQLIRPGRLAEYTTEPRPADTSLDCAKAQSLLPFSLPKFSAWLRERLLVQRKD